MDTLADRYGLPPWEQARLHRGEIRMMMQGYLDNERERQQARSDAQHTANGGASATNPNRASQQRRRDRMWDRVTSGSSSEEVSA